MLTEAKHATAWIYEIIKRICNWGAQVDETKKEITAMLNKEKHIALATCAGEHVTARTMSYVNKD